MLEKLIDEIGRFLGRFGGQVVIALNPENTCSCPMCNGDDPLNAEIIDESGGDQPN